jgi:hypothetical protein
MKIKTSELTGTALDWAVGVVKGLGDLKNFALLDHPFSESWAYGGPIIEREEMTVGTDRRGQWDARIYEDHAESWCEVGPTPLIAAMRCYVASKLGDEVDVPEELT